MYREHQRRQKLAQMNEQQRLKAEEEHRRQQDELRKHDRLPKPASKEQLEQVWEEEDGMAREEFNPRTFFHMHGEPPHVTCMHVTCDMSHAPTCHMHVTCHIHDDSPTCHIRIMPSDTNADLTLDPLELEALFMNEVSAYNKMLLYGLDSLMLLQLKKVYKDDLAGLEAHEDLARMREYAMGEVRLYPHHSTSPLIHITPHTPHSYPSSHHTTYPSLVPLITSRHIPLTRTPHHITPHTPHLYPSSHHATYPSLIPPYSYLIPLLMTPHSTPHS